MGFPIALLLIPLKDQRPGHPVSKTDSFCIKNKLVNPFVGRIIIDNHGIHSGICLAHD
jgi:hypothetical protein